MTRLTCSECGSRPAISASTPKCEVCLYAESVGRAKAERQVQASEAERERIKAERKGRK